MTESLQTDECLASQTQSCCEGGRRPSVPFNERNSLRMPRIDDVASDYCVVLNDAHAWANCRDVPADEVAQVAPVFSKEQVDRIAAIADGTDALEALTAERGEVYGPFDINMYGTALQISGMLAQYYQRTDLPVLPAYMAAMIMTAYKSNRMVRTPDHEDSHTDDANYKRFAKVLGKDIKAYRQIAETNPH